MDLKRNDKVKGWFGTAIVTDVATGRLETNAGVPYGDTDNMVRIMQRNRRGRPVYTYIYREDVTEVL